MEGRAMPTTSSTAMVEHALLVQSDSSEDAISVGSPAWYAWLASATAFAFRGTDVSNFTFAAT
jgi:hypothetical protein